METIVDGAPGFVFRNAAGAASYHAGYYLGAMEAFEKSIAGGGPVGPPTLAYLMAANQKLDRFERGRKLSEQFTQTWPNVRIDLVLHKLFAEQNYADDVVNAMKDAGWR